jgi:hypothetical protein
MYEWLMSGYTILHGWYVSWPTAEYWYPAAVTVAGSAEHYIKPFTGCLPRGPVPNINVVSVKLLL